MQSGLAKKQIYSMSFIAAITQDKLLCSEFVEGGYDATLFEDTVYQMLKHIRSDEQTARQNVVLFMDNAVIHHHSYVLQTCRKLKVNVLFNAQYSPWLNPVE
jgi:DDE superfamily endonuclease